MELEARIVEYLKNHADGVTVTQVADALEESWGEVDVILGELTEQGQASETTLYFPMEK